MTRQFQIIQTKMQDNKIFGVIDFLCARLKMVRSKILKIDDRQKRTLLI